MFPEHERNQRKVSQINNRKKKGEDIEKKEKENTFAFIHLTFTRK
jgi:hypothetical protein